MFKDLYAVARHTPLHLIITPAGEGRLKVIVTPKPSGDAANNAALAKPWSAIGTVEELETEFPAAALQYTTGVNDLRASINLPLDLFDAAKKKQQEKEAKAADKKKKEEEEAQRRSESAKKAAETRAQKEAERKAEEERKKKEREERAAAKKAGKAGAAGGLQLPGATATAETNPVLNGLPGKDDCIRDYQDIKRVHGDKLTRRLFIKKSKTGRRYEKLWKNWEKFVKEAAAQLDLPLETGSGSAASTAQQQGSAGDGTAAAAAGAGANEGSTPSGSVKRTILITPVSAGDEPAPKAESTLMVKGSSPTMFTDVYDEAGKYLSSITSKPELGKHLGLAGHDGLLVITAIEQRPSGGLDVTVKLDNKSEAAPDAEAGAPGASASAPVPAPEKKFALYAPGGELVKQSRWPFTSGERIQIAFGAEFAYVVLGADPADEHRFLAEKRLADPMTITDESGRELGATDAIYVPTDKVAELTAGDFVVIDIDESRGYVVRDYSKPRWKVFNAAGDEIGFLEIEPKVGDTIDVGDHKGLKVFEVDGNECSAAKPRIKGPVAAVTEGA